MLRINETFYSSSQQQHYVFLQSQETMDLHRRIFVQVRGKRLLWLNRPSWEWRSLLHWMHLWMISSVLITSGYSFGDCICPQQPVSVGLYLGEDQLATSASTCHDRTPVSPTSQSPCQAISYFACMLKRRWGRPCAGFPETNLPDNKSFGILPSGVQ